MKRDKGAVVLLSGGIDSTITAAIARSEGYGIYALSFDYGQRHGIELQSAKRIAQWLSVERHLIVSFDLSEIARSALTTDIEVPKDGLKIGTIPVTYVPARNTIFLSFALAWAESLGIGDIFIGANAVDYSGYPDCRPEYLQAFEAMANLATKASVEGKSRFNIRAPLLYMTKAEIIKRGIELGIDYSLTWSCYDPLHSNGKIVPCGECDSCRYRKKGFSEAGLL